jgi:hypothetical protein
VLSGKNFKVVLCQAATQDYQKLHKMVYLPSTEGIVNIGGPCKFPQIDSQIGGRIRCSSNHQRHTCDRIVPFVKKASCRYGDEGIQQGVRKPWVGFDDDDQNGKLPKMDKHIC